MYRLGDALINHADGCSGVGQGGGGVDFTGVCLSVYPHDISKIAADTLDIQMDYHDSWKPIYFRAGLNRSRSQLTRRGFLHSCECRLLPVVPDTI